MIAPIAYVLFYYAIKLDPNRGQTEPKAVLTLAREQGTVDSVQLCGAMRGLTASLHMTPYVDFTEDYVGEEGKWVWKG